MSTALVSLTVTLLSVTIGLLYVVIYDPTLPQQLNDLLKTSVISVGRPEQGSPTLNVEIIDHNINDNSNEREVVVPDRVYSDRELNGLLLSHIYTLTPLNETMHGEK